MSKVPPELDSVVAVVTLVPKVIFCSVPLVKVS